MNKIKSRLKQTFIYSIWNNYKKNSKKDLEEKEIISQWNSRGRPVPIPQIFKRCVIKKYAKNFHSKILVESGTYMGDTVEDCKSLFKKIFSIELDNILFKNAKKRFQPDSHILIVHGDSGERIKEIITGINEPCIFWLDGHYSEGITAKGDLSTPILQELNHIFNHIIDNHVILIDDARCFTGEDDYPTIEELKNFVKSRKPYFQFSVINDIIRIHK